MEKQTIEIRKIKDGLFLERKDEVAIEQDFEIRLKNGEMIYGSCTPTHMEEMVLGSRYLADDLTKKEQEQYGLTKVEKIQMESVYVQDFFAVAENCFEHPGSLFADTGCAHSCALIYEGKVLCQMEDIGRYNALDKAIGFALKHQIPFSAAYVFASGRISAGYITKAVKAGFPMVVSRAAVTRAAVDIAKKENVTLVGFIRKNSGNIYHEGKVKLHGESR